MKTTAIYPGTFDPITNGHLDIIQRAAHMFDRLIIAIAASSRKSPSFSLEKRTKLVQLASKAIPNIEVCYFDGLLINFAKAKNATLIVRGLRAVSDFEYELQLAEMNRRMSPTIETIFLTPAEQHAFISATIVREILSMGGDISAFVPAVVLQELKRY